MESDPIVLISSFSDGERLLSLSTRFNGRVNNKDKLTGVILQLSPDASG